MKLNELKINEGLVDATILMSLDTVVARGITNTVEVTVLAKSLMAIFKGYTFSTSEFNSYFNEFFPMKVVTDEIKALPKERAQQLAFFALSTLNAKNVQLASYDSFKSIGEIIAYATRTEAND